MVPWRMISQRAAGDLQGRKKKRGGRKQKSISNMTTRKTKKCAFLPWPLLPLEMMDRAWLNTEPNDSELFVLWCIIQSSRRSNHWNAFPFRVSSRFFIDHGSDHVTKIPESKFKKPQVTHTTSGVNAVDILTLQDSKFLAGFNILMRL